MDKQKTPLNYEPLESTLSWSKYFKSSFNNFKASPLNIIGRIILVIFFSLLSFIYLTVAASIISEITSPAVQIVVLLISLVLYGIICYAVMYEFKKIMQKSLRMSSFVKVNQLKYVSVIRDPAYSGLIFNQGHSRIISEALQFPQYDGLEIGNFIYTTGSGKSSTDHTYGYMKIQLPRKLPHMLLDAKSNNFMGKMSNLPMGFSDEQVLELEGDFNNYFTLYVPKAYERDALYVFTPDVMQTLIHLNNNFDIEIVDDTLCVYFSYGLELAEKDSLQNLLSIATVLTKEIAKQSVNYADDAIGNRSINIVAPEGQRLQTSKFYLYIKIGAFVVISALFVYIFFVVG